MLNQHVVRQNARSKRECRDEFVHAPKVRREAYSLKSGTIPGLYVDGLHSSSMGRDVRNSNSRSVVSAAVRLIVDGTG